MNHQNTASRLEARSLTPRSTPPSRKSLRPTGEQLAKGLVQLVATIATQPGRTAGRTSAPAQLFYDVKREREVSLATWLCTIVALSRDPRVTDAQLAELEIEFSAQLRSLRPYTALSVRTQWERETRAGCEADLSQAPASMAREFRDVCALERAMVETREAIAEQQLLLVSYHVLHREMLA